MLAIVDYGMGNLRSVQKGFEKVGQRAEIVRRPVDLNSVAGLVLPGVGAFGDAMASLRKSGLDQAIYNEINRGKPFLGICLGYQLLFEASEEWGLTPGLGVFPGCVRRLPPGLKVPHMGWNQVEFTRSCPLWEGIPSNSAFYFVHSYYVDTADQEIIMGKTDYGVKFASAVGLNKVFGVQFHPEKSSVLGLQILLNFGRLVAQC
ncbi:MAG: imidazole glycerol phosphate synthase subunit HisH [Bacillota bacterium]